MGVWFIKWYWMALRATELRFRDSAVLVPVQALHKIIAPGRALAVLSPRVGLALQGHGRAGLIDPGGVSPIPFVNFGHKWIFGFVLVCRG